ncbi:hypothetical protein HOP50_03g21260 [Chloropicon primus]|uniref:Uncharacterized protein n=2 Tax=Chloropicon primus TaxID=1764295 RepID=A0A5B8MG18_9CHLO|nr:hypothetical protein A3770_03p21260 [Chloropicon primus]UPQ98820.1 hypothetical protein HOP50_03g21260 [Chloropicon primus]|eukprot:QDZ19608.1 hypothetical protein A3770_03p21260 [Chloropicon primus]
MGYDKGEVASLFFQMLASCCWTSGAALAGPASTADWLQFFAAVSWIVANLAAAYSMGLFGFGGGAAPDAQGASMTSSMRGLLNSTKSIEAVEANGKEKEAAV